MRLPSRLATSVQECSPCSVTRLGVAARQSGAHDGPPPASGHSRLGTPGPGSRAAAALLPKHAPREPAVLLLRPPALLLDAPPGSRLGAGAVSTALLPLLLCRRPAAVTIRRGGATGQSHTHTRTGRGTQRRASGGARQHCSLRACPPARTCRPPCAVPLHAPPSSQTSWPCVPWSPTTATSLAALLAEGPWLWRHLKNLQAWHSGLCRTRLQAGDEPFTYIHAPRCAVRSPLQNATAAAQEARDTRASCSAPVPSPFQERAWRSSATRALGVTPGTRAAAASVTGLARDSASASSAERPGRRE